MRFFKANETVQSDEDRARDARLTAIASRYRPLDPLEQLGEPDNPVEPGDQRP